MDSTRMHRKKSTACRLLLMSLVFLMAGCAAGGDRVRTDTDQSGSVKAITAITTVEDADSARVLIEGSRELTYTAVKKPAPPAVVLYFPETALQTDAQTSVTESDVIEAITATELKADGRALRLEIVLKTAAAYAVTREGGGLEVTFTKEFAAAAPAAAHSGPSIPPAPVTETKTAAAAHDAGMMSAGSHTGVTLAASGADSGEKVASEPAKTVEKAPAEEQTDPEPAAAPPAWVNRIDFSAEEAGKSTVIIGTTRPVAYEITKKTNTLLRLKLFGTNLPDYRRYPLITTRFESAVDRIIPIQQPDMQGETVFAIELREAVPFYVEQNEAFIAVHFEASTIPPKPLEEANLPSWKKVMDQVMTETPPPAPATEASAAVEAPLSPAEAPYEAGATFADIGVGAPPRKFVGEKIALDFFETDIKNVFRILREISGKNFAIDKDVTGRVTLTLDKPVPWDQVLDLVLRMNQLGMKMEGDIIRISTLATLKAEEDLRAAKIAAEQKSLAQEKALEPLVTEYIAVNYSSAEKEILPHLKNILTPERGSVSVDTRNNQIIITDIAEKIRQAKEIVQRIDKVTPQVIIEARIAEVSTDFSTELGFDWTASAGPVFNDTMDGNFTGNMAMNFPAASATSTMGFTFDKIIGTPFVLNATLNALESNGDGKIISSPKIVTLDNKKATIKQGIEYPYLERDDTGGSSVSFKNIDLLLEVTPHVTPDNRVSVEISITKNDIDTITNGVPSLSTNEAQTELLVNDGDTIVIGGIMKTRKTSSVSGFPWLSKIPLLGWIFKTEKEERENNELLIFITPKIVKLEQRGLL